MAVELFAFELLAGEAFIAELLLTAELFVGELLVTLDGETSVLETLKLDRLVEAETFDGVFFAVAPMTAVRKCYCCSVLVVSTLSSRFTQIWRPLLSGG